MNLIELHKQALSEGWAMGHFNFASLAQLNGILDAAREAKAPVVVGLSEGEREFIGLKQAVYLVQSFRESHGIPVFLNADHSHSVEAAKAACDAGFDSIHIDLSKKPYEENLDGVKRVIDYVKSKDPDVEVEGELGYLVTDSSKVYKEKIEIPEESYTKVDEAVKFVQETKIDRFAPAVGTAHGIVADEKLRFELMENLRKALPEVTLVLHGGSGIPGKDMARAATLGFNNIHVSTELRVAYTKALRGRLMEKPDEIAPYKYSDTARAAVAEVVKEKLQLFGAVGKA